MTSQIFINYNLPLSHSSYVLWNRYLLLILSPSLLHFPIKISIWFNFVVLSQHTTIPTSLCCVPKNETPQLLVITSATVLIFKSLLPTDLQGSSLSICVKRLPIHIHYAAMLPCEMWKFKTANLSQIPSKIIKCTWNFNLDDTFHPNIPAMIYFIFAQYMRCMIMQRCSECGPMPKSVQFIRQITSSFSKGDNKVRLSYLVQSVYLIIRLKFKSSAHNIHL